MGPVPAAVSQHLQDQGLDGPVVFRPGDFPATGAQQETPILRAGLPGPIPEVQGCQHLFAKRISKQSRPAEWAHQTVFTRPELETRIFHHPRMAVAAGLLGITQVLQTQQLLVSQVKHVSDCRSHPGHRDLGVQAVTHQGQLRERLHRGQDPGLVGQFTVHKGGLG